MKMKSAFILSAAAMMLSAVPAQAQTYGSGNNYGDSHKTQAQEEAKRTAQEEAMKKAKEQMMRAEEELRAKEEAMMKAEDSMMVKDDAMMKDEDAMMVKDEPMMDEPMMKDPDAYGSGNNYGSAPMGKPDNCPPNTKAQDNGTCMLISGSLPAY